MPRHKVVPHAQWLAARKKLLTQEKKFARLRDELGQKRRNLPWERVDKDYSFEGPEGRETLAGLFGGRTQLVVYHFMFGPDWKVGCPHCSRWADNFNGIIVHLNQRDVTMVAISRAPYRKLAAYRKRMGWNFEWLSSHATDFNFDYQASFHPDELSVGRAHYNFTMQDPGSTEREGISVFVKDKRGRVFHTYSTYARGIEDLNLDYRYLDLVPKGRDEDGRGPFWVRRNDEYQE